jgi:hypothetical protein
MNRSLVRQCSLKKKKKEKETNDDLFFFKKKDVEPISKIFSLE